jgi:hypothetical protein
LYVWAANIGYIVNGVMVKRTDAIRNSLQESTKDCPPFPVDFRTYPDGSIVVTDVERDFSVYVEYSTQLVHHIGK